MNVSLEANLGQSKDTMSIDALWINTSEVVI